MSTLAITRPPRLSELRFFFQPIVPLARGAPGWSEALVRWGLPDGTVRGPLDVLPHWLAPPRLATFTRYTLEQAATGLARLPQAHLSVNLSPAQAIHPVTIQTLDGLLPEIRSRLRIEITEQRVGDLNTLATSLGALRERCEGVLLDDVTPADLDPRSHGSVDVDGVKLDRSVLASLLTATNGAAARRFVAAATERFALVVAEGVEDPDLCDTLRELGVSHAQGFGLARPRQELEGTWLDRRIAFRPPAPTSAPAPQRPGADCVERLNQGE